MIARAIQEKTGTPARDAPLRGKQPAVTAKCSRAAACFTTKKSIKIPFRRELFTFSTGFSTRKPRSAYTRRNAARRFVPVSGKKSGHFAFYKKESRSFFFSFYSSHPQPFFVLSRLEKSSPEFSTSRKGSFFVWKKRGKLQFSTACRRTLQGHRQCVRTRSKSTCILCFCRGCATSKKQPGKVKTLFRAA